MKRKPVILIAEDDSAMRRWLLQVLSPLARHIYQAAHGGELSTILGALQVDLVVADVRMPIRSGIEALMDARAAGLQTPFVLITGFGGDAGVQVAAARYGAEILDKPFEAEALRARVQQVCEATGDVSDDGRARSGPVGAA